VKEETNDIRIAGQNFTLLPQKAAIWKERRILLIADVHAGKATHFRKNGIPLSTDHLLEDLNTIAIILTTYDIEKIIFLGDLYHTSQNIENTLIDDWLGKLSVDVELIIGNHDRHSLRYSKLVKREAYVQDKILLSHEPEESEYFNICGHLHPAYTLKGKARLHIKLPAFYHGTNFLILPAFGSINGGKMYKDLAKKSSITLISSDSLIKV
jgi:DNA ligase-associated metallophosphoesterase